VKERKKKEPLRRIGPGGSGAEVWWEPGSRGRLVTDEVILIII